MTKFKLEQVDVTNDDYEDDEDLMEIVVALKLIDEDGDEEVVIDIHYNGLSRWWSFSMIEDEMIRVDVVGVDMEIFEGVNHVSE